MDKRKGTDNKKHTVTFERAREKRVMDLSPRAAVIGQRHDPLEMLRSHDTLTQDMMAAATKIIENAMKCGASHARVQLLRQRYGHFNYVTTAEGTLTLPVHDAQTLVKLEGGARQRVHLSRPAQDIINWVRGQGLQVLCATSATQAGRLNHEPALASWLYVVAVFVPPGESDAGRLRWLWNCQYMTKCLDASAIDGWTIRCQRALRVGASHCVLCTLYRESDFTQQQAAEEDSVYCVNAPRHHLTMQVLEGQRWVLDKRFCLLIGFARSYGYAWTLCLPGNDGDNWAYFTILLDPLTQYEQLDHHHQ